MSPRLKKTFTTIMVVLTIILVVWLLIAPSIFTFKISDKNALRQFADIGFELIIKDLKIKNRNIHYMVVGSERLPTLVFLHGSPSSWNAFIDYMKDLELLKKYRMVGIDRPGFGSSDFGYAVNIPDQASLILPILKELENGKPVFLVGHSLGCPLEIKIASDFPDGIAGIMLIAASIDPALEPKESWRKFLEVFPIRYFVPGAFRPSNTELLFFKKDIVDLEKDFPNVKCDVWLVHGDKDTWVPPGNSDYAKQKLVNASKVELHILPGGDHFIPWTRRREITERILEMTN